MCALVFTHSSYIMHVAMSAGCVQQLSFPSCLMLRANLPGAEDHGAGCMQARLTTSSLCSDVMLDINCLSLFSLSDKLFAK